MSGTTLKLYLDFFSQPSRALYIFLKINQIPFELHQVSLKNGEHLSEEFKNELNRFQKVPFIHDGDFKLTESIAIVRYVAEKCKLDNNWYSTKDFQKRAEVDEYLEWQHTNTRACCALYFLKKCVYPLLTGEPPKPDSLQKLKNNMINCLANIENIWLAKTPYLSGNEISVADIFAACEIEQTRLADFDPTEGRPVLGTWLNRVRQECNPFYQEAHLALNETVQRMKDGQPTIFT